MSDYRRTLEDHAESLTLLNEGLQDADGLMVFLMAFATTLRALDDDDGCTTERNRFLQELDSNLKYIQSGLGSGPGTVQAVSHFRQKLDQLIGEMDMYQKPPQ